MTLNDHEANPSAVLYGIGDLRVEERPVPRPAVGQVLVRIGAVGVCGSDVHYYDHGRIGDYVVRAPMVLGHESAGTIVAVGAGVEPTRVGELVAIEPGVPDYTCEECLHGRYNLCVNMRFFATPPIDGALAKYVAIDARFAHRAPDGMSAEEAAMAEPVSVGLWACRKAAVSVGDRVLVTGAGPVGLFAAQVARAFGATSVGISDVAAARRTAAAELGFTAYDAAHLPEESFDVLLECSGAPSAIVDGLRHLVPAGRAVLIGMGPDEVAVPLPLVQNRELVVTGVFRYANTYPDALDLIARGAIDLGMAITHRFTLEEAEQALTIARRDERTIKPVVLP